MHKGLKYAWTTLYWTDTLVYTYTYVCVCTPKNLKQHTQKCAFNAINQLSFYREQLDIKTREQIKKSIHSSYQSSFRFINERKVFHKYRHEKLWCPTIKKKPNNNPPRKQTQKLQGVTTSANTEAPAL